MTGLLRDRGRVTRDVEGGRDSHNQVVLTPTTIATGVPCLLQARPRVEPETRATKQLVEATHRIYMAPGTDLTEKDRFTIEDEMGEPTSEVFEIVFVDRRPGGVLGALLQVDAKELRV